ncbi:putative inhibitor of growth protein 3 [Paratrimastix pyriformis]|uniref:Inhibitor of growth protein n=1 Tax=Paratrimastix pyriformis TaxID=342808 RepID=A0ABQ8UJN9_9EUKA|nr:putative inhibitor of growth protein 3 [Paratrimastix pyriformis]
MSRGAQDWLGEYLDRISSFPPEFRRLSTLMRDLDKKCNDQLAEFDKQAQLAITSGKRAGVDNRPLHVHTARECYRRAHQYSEEKIGIASQLCEQLDRHFTKLEEDIRTFEGEINEDKRPDEDGEPAPSPALDAYASGHASPAPRPSPMAAPLPMSSPALPAPSPGGLPVRKSASTASASATPLHTPHGHLLGAAAQGSTPAASPGPAATATPAPSPAPSTPAPPANAAGTPQLQPGRPPSAAAHPSGAKGRGGAGESSSSSSSSSESDDSEESPSPEADDHDPDGASIEDSRSEEPQPGPSGAAPMAIGPSLVGHPALAPKEKRSPDGAEWLPAQAQGGRHGASLGGRGTPQLPAGAAKIHGSKAAGAVVPHGTSTGTRGRGRGGRGVCIAQDDGPSIGEGGGAKLAMLAVAVTMTMMMPASLLTVRSGGRLGLQRGRGRGQSAAAVPDHAAGGESGLSGRTSTGSADEGGDDAQELNRVYCTCRRPADGEMVFCEDEKCPIGWFHFECVGLSQAPPENEKWYCPDCRKTHKRRRQR